MLRGGLGGFEDTTITKDMKIRSTKASPMTMKMTGLLQFIQIMDTMDIMMGTTDIMMGITDTMMGTTADTMMDIMTRPFTECTIIFLGRLIDICSLIHLFVHT